MTNDSNTQEVYNRSQMMELPNDEIMRAMSKIAWEKATIYFAEMAENLAGELPAGLTGEEAMKALAEAIRNTNAKVYPPTNQD